MEGVPFLGVVGINTWSTQIREQGWLALVKNSNPKSPQMPGFWGPPPMKAPPEQATINQQQLLDRVMKMNQESMSNMMTQMNQNMMNMMLQMN